MYPSKTAKFFVATLTLFTLTSLQANCDKLLKEAKKNGSNTLIIAFDGLGTAEFGMGVLRRRVVSKVEERCGANRISSEDFYYSKKGAKKAVACAKAFEKEFGSSFSLHVMGHSFGAGKGVFNFIKAAKGTGLNIENAITFDPRGYSYKYSAPSKKQVENFVNIYQNVPLAGRPVKGADFERNVTGKASHVGLPRVMADMALENVIGGLSCAKP